MLAEPRPSLPRGGLKFFVIAITLLPSLVWVSRDRGVWPWDQAWYGEVSVDLWYWLGHSGAQWFRTMIESLPLKPPGIVWLGQFFVPLSGLIGSPESSLLLSIVLTQFILLVILWRIGQHMAPRSQIIPMAGVLFAVSAQLFVGLSHQFFVEPLQAVAVAWCFYIALKAPEWRRLQIAVHLISALILGALAKSTTPAYCLMPSMYTALVFVFKRPSPRTATEPKLTSTLILIPIFGLLGIMGGLWYLHNFANVWQHAHDASFGDLALNYGARDTIPRKLVTWSHIFINSFLAPYLSWGLLIAFATGAAFVGFRRTLSISQFPRIQILSVLSALQIGLMLFIFSMSIGVDSRFIYSLLPSVVILLVQFCVFLPRNVVYGLVMLASVQWLTLNAVSFGFAGRLANQAEYLLPVQTDRAQYDELARVIQFTSQKGEHYNILGVEYPWMNANSAEFFSAKERLRTGAHSPYTSLGYAEKDVDVAMRRFEELQTHYLITVAEQYQIMPPNFLNLISVPFLKRVEQDPRFRQVPFTSEDGILVFEFTPRSSASGSQPTTREVPVVPKGDRVPSDISQARVKNRGKSALAWINGAQPQENQGKRVFSVQGGSLYSCDGWAYDELDNSTPEEVWIELTNSATGMRYYWQAARYRRSELAKSLKIPSIEMSGIKCTAGSAKIPDGLYRLKVYQIQKKAAIVSEFNTYEESPTVKIQSRN